ncbi:MAG: hypothetical protein AB7O47_09210 [Flavobacteriales bacterium]
MLFTLLLSLTKVNAQYASQEELKKAAQTFFDEESYIEALPLYSQLLSLYPKDPEYNYRYGACYFFGNREKEDALKYLNFAVGKPNVNPQAFYFLGLALHHEYRFSEAEVNYKKFKEKGTPKDIQYFQVDRKIEMCRNGVTLLKSMTDIGVLQKKEIKASEFFRSYDLRGIGGKIIVKPDEFKTKLDIKNKEYSIIHLGDKPTMVVFSSFGNDGKSGKDIYKVIKLPNGEWSKPAPFPKINTNFDEDYPFLHPDGKTLYFSSKGYNSMGGYDVFKSTLDPSSGEWTFPENLDFPINTPDDDILFISDIDNQLAYFASSRASKQGELTVYKVQVDRQPAENTIVKGFFLAESNPNMKSATISIMDVEKDRKYGVFSSNRENGEYLLVFPGNGGKFKILVETTNDAPVHSAVIELPTLDGFRALKQELRLVGEGDNEKLVVKNLFNESDEFDITDPLVVENLLKYKAKMDVNLTEEEALKNLDKSSSNAGISSLASVSNQQLADNAKKSADKVAENAKLSKNQANFAYDLAAQKSVEAKKALNQSLQKQKIASESEDENTKALALKDAERLKYIAAGLVNESISAMDVAKSIESEAVERESDVKKTLDLSNSIASNVNVGNRAEAETNYLKLEEITNSTYNKESALEGEKKVLENKLSETEIEYGKVRNNVIELKNRETEIQENINNLTERINKSSKKSEKEAWQGEIDALKIDLEDIKYDLGVAQDKELDLGKQLKELERKSNTTLGIIATVESLNTQTTTKAPDKTALNNDLIYFEKQGLIGLYPSDESTVISTASKSVDLLTLKDEYDIISDEGKIIDYNSKHSSQLVDAQSNPNEYQKSLEMAKINQDWISDINQEIAIKEKQLDAAESLNDKTKITSRIEILKNLKTEKQKEADKYLVLAQEENPAKISSSSNTSTTSTTKTVTEPVNVVITDNAGNVIDYATNYENELANIDGETPTDISNKIAVHEKWKNANEQEILLKKIELNSAEDEEKETISNRIAELENQKTNNEEFIAIYNSKLGNEDNLAVNTAVSSSSTTENKNTPVNNKIDYTKYNEKVVNSNGEVQDYNTEFNNKFAEADNIVDPLTSKKEKEKVLKEWSESVNEEIKIKNDELLLADELEKEPINERLTVLNNEKNSLDKQLSEISLSVKQQESLMAIKNRPTIDESNTLSTNNLVEDNSPYSSQQAKKEYKEVTKLEEELNQLNALVEEKSASVYALKDESKKQEVLNEVAVLKEDVENKKLEVASAKAKANKAEYYNNQAALSAVKKSATATGDNATVGELNEDEANIYFEKAQTERTNAESAATFASKELALLKAQEFEATAIEKQRRAIELYSNKNANEVLASLPKESNITENVKSNSVNTTTNVVENKTTINSNSVPTISNTTIYQPSKVGMPSDNEIAKAKTAEKEASRLEKLATILQDSAQKITEKAEKEALVAEANSNTEKAKQLRKEAEISYASAEEMASEEKSTVEAINANRTALGSEQFTSQDKQLINSLSGTELAELKNSTEYQKYTENKKESRRLIKEAEVDYIQADKFQEEAEDQKTLGISLNAMAKGAQGDGKTKLLGQIEKLNNMIAENETKALETRASATQKEIEALEKIKVADNVLASSSRADQIKAIEKAALYDNNYLNTALANNTAVAKTTQPELAENNTSNTTSTNKIAETTEPELAENQVIEENTNSNASTAKTNSNTVNTLEPELAENNVVEENTTSITTNTNTGNNTKAQTTEPEIAESNVVEENKTPTTNNITEPVVDKIDISKVDEIPTVLNQPIFVLTENKKAAYSESKKIPVAKLPEGLVFKVQIGAFRNPIPQDHFVGFAPISAEDAGNGITRYTAGLFNTFNMANEAKNSIRTIGYPDAFVVAFYNGKRININEARAMAGGGTVAENNSQLIVNSSQPANNTDATNTNTNNTSTTSKELPAPKTNVELVEDGISTDVNKIKGVFFTVQVGVYSRPITAEQLNNLSPLNSERTSNGLIRYTSGVYPTINEANSAKARIVDLGITDAFVIAYANGNRIGVNEAIGLSTDKNNVVTTTGNNSTVENNKTTNSVGNEEVVIPGNNSKIVYTLILGEYTDEVPVEDAAVYLKLSGKGLKVEEKNGKTVYSMGPYSDYNTANDARAEMKAEGVKNPKVVALNGNENPEMNEETKTVGNTNTTNTTANNTDNNTKTNITPTTNNTSNNTTTSANTPITNTTTSNATTNTVPSKQPINQVEVGKALKIVYKVLLGEYTAEVPVEESMVYLKFSNSGIEIKEVDGKTIYTMGEYPDYPSALDLQIQMKVEGIKSPKVIAFKDGTQIEVSEALELVKNYNK